MPPLFALHATPPPAGPQPEPVDAPADLPPGEMPLGPADVPNI